MNEKGESILDETGNKNVIVAFEFVIKWYYARTQKFHLHAEVVNSSFYYYYSRKYIRQFSAGVAVLLQKYEKSLSIIWAQLS